METRLKDIWDQMIPGDIFTFGDSYGFYCIKIDSSWFKCPALESFPERIHHDSKFFENRNMEIEDFILTSGFYCSCDEYSVLLGLPLKCGR